MDTHPHDVRVTKIAKADCLTLKFSYSYFVLGDSWIFDCRVFRVQDFRVVGATAICVSVTELKHYDNNLYNTFHIKLNILQ